MAESFDDQLESSSPATLSDIIETYSQFWVEVELAVTYRDISDAVTDILEGTKSDMDQVVNNHTDPRSLIDALREAIEGRMGFLTDDEGFQEVASLKSSFLNSLSAYELTLSDEVPELSPEDYENYYEGATEASPEDDEEF